MLQTSNRIFVTFPVTAMNRRLVGREVATLDDRRHGVVRLASWMDLPCSHHRYFQIGSLVLSKTRSEPYHFLECDQKIHVRISENLTFQCTRRDVRFVTLAVDITSGDCYVS